MEHDPDWYEEKIARFLVEEFHPGDKGLRELRDKWGSDLASIFLFLVTLQGIELERIGETPDLKH